MLSYGMQCYHLELMLSCGANVVMLSFGANVIIWNYHVMLSSGMITPPFFIFPENFTHSYGAHSIESLMMESITGLLAETVLNHTF